MRKLFLLLLICWMGGCVQKRSDSLPTIDLKGAGKGDTLKMSDIVERIRVVPLETHPDALLPGYFDSWIGDKYIITLGRQEIQLFSADGKYIRKLAQEGRGPEEYIQIGGYCVDENERYLYLADVGGIHVIELETGRMLQKLSFKEGFLRALLYVGDQTLAYVAATRSKQGEQYQIGRMKTDGTLLGSVRVSNKMKMSNKLYLGECENKIHYKINFGDTLYVLQDTSQLPYCRILSPKPYSDELKSGQFVNVIFENKADFILLNSKIELRSSGENVLAQTRYLAYYLVHKADFKLSQISGFYIDLLDFTFENFIPIRVTGRRVYWNVNVMDFKNIMKTRLDNVLVADSLKTLYAELDDDDNSLVIVGDIKE